jgi:hypothetical protein
MYAVCPRIGTKFRCLSSSLCCRKFPKHILRTLLLNRFFGRQHSCHLQRRDLNLRICEIRHKSPTVQSSTTAAPCTAINQFHKPISEKHFLLHKFIPSCFTTTTQRMDDSKFEFVNHVAQVECRNSALMPQLMLSASFLT